jgi:hypothetical protein
MRLHWHEVREDDDPIWGYQHALHTHLAPLALEVYYVGKCDGTTVRGRWR